MDVFLIKSGVIQNCISAESTAAAQTAYPTFTVVQRTGSNTVYGVGDLYSGSVFSFSTKPAVTPTSEPIPTWVANRSYAVGERAVSPTNRNIICRVAHTSTSVYDARKWTYPGDRNETIVDWTLLPDGNIITTEPTVGSITSWGPADADLSNFVIKDGRLQDWRANNAANASPANGYFTVYLPDSTERIKHLWIEYEIPASTPSTEVGGVTLLLQSPYQDESVGISAGLHNQLYTMPFTAGNNIANWPQGGYGLPANPTFSTATITANSNQVVITGVNGTIVPGLQLTGVSGGDFLKHPYFDAQNSIVLITGQISGTTGGAGTYSIGIPNNGSAATATGFLQAKIDGPVFRPQFSIVGRRIRVEFVIEHETGGMYGYINGVLCSHWVNPGNTAYCGHKGMFQGPGRIYSKICQFGVSAYLPEFYTSDRGRLPCRIWNGYFALTGPSGQYVITSTWQKVSTITVGFSFSGLVEVNWNPLIFCTAGSVYMELAPATSEPPSSPSPCKVAEATTKCRIAFSQVYVGTPGTVKEISIWVKTDGTASFGDPYYTAGASGGASWRTVVENGPSNIG